MSTSEEAPRKDIETARATFDGFMVFVKWGTIVAAILAVIAVLLIAS